MNNADAIIAGLSFDENGLIPAVAQQYDSGEVLMLAWMNEEAIRRTLDSGQVYYWSRSRGKLWRKGEASGHVQKVKSVRLDCDGDAVLIEVEQQGGIACHTGRVSCFFQRLDNGTWAAVDPVLKDPREIYRK